MEMKMNRIAISMAAIAASLCAGSALAQGAEPSTDNFIAKAAAGGMAEVQAGQLASTKATDKSVKQFGMRMVKDHSKANAEFKAILGKEKKDPPPPELDADGKSLMDKLNAASGADFDKTYVDAMVEDHDKDVQEFGDYAKSGDDKRIKAFAKKTLAVIKHHDMMIHAIQKKMEKSASR
jgi:putative membrane protein